MEEEEFLKELEEEFYAESESIFQSLEESLLRFEQAGENSDLDEINQMLHSMKGSAQAVDLDSLGSFLHKFETFIQEANSQDRKLFVSHCLNYIDRLKDYVQRLSDGDDVSEVEAALNSVKTAA